MPVVVDLWAPWCLPCRAVASALGRVAGELAGRVKLVKVDLDDAPRLSERFAVRAVPTLMVMRRPGRRPPVGRGAGGCAVSLGRAGATGRDGHAPGRADRTTRFRRR
jgi:thiol-disulfide isomerase/thioredoxin